MALEKIPTICQNCPGVHLLEYLNMTTNDSVLADLALQIAEKRVNSDTAIKDLVTEKIVLKPPCAADSTMVLLWNNWLFNYIDSQRSMYPLGQDKIYLGDVLANDPYADNPDFSQRKSGCQLKLFQSVTKFEQLKIAARNLKRLQRG